MSSAALVRLPSHYWVKVTSKVAIEATTIDIKSADRPPKLASVPTELSIQGSQGKHVAFSPGVDTSGDAEDWLKNNPDWLKDADSFHLIKAVPELPM